MGYRFLRRGMPCALLALCAGLSACGGKSDASPPDATASASGDSGKNGAPLVHKGNSIAVPQTSPLRQALEVAAAAETTVVRPITVPGVVEADPARLIKVVPPVAGRIERLHKRLGDAVRIGDPLFTLDSADLAQVTSDAAKAQAALALAEHNLARQQELVNAEIAPRKDLQQAQSDHAQAQSEMRRAQARLSQLGGTPGQGSGRQYTMKSPIAGHVIEQTGAQGGFWNDTNAPVMTVADLSKVWLAASVQEKDLAAVFVGQEARIALNAYPGEAITGKVAYVGQMLDPDTRTVKVRVALDNAAGRLRPGMYASAVFSGAAHQAVTVPTTALIQDGFNTRVFVEQVPWTYESRVIKTGPQIGSQVEIASGLKQGERVVVKDGVLLND